MTEDVARPISGPSGAWRLFSRLDWLVAWRHLRTGDSRPKWVLPLLLGAVYLLLVGGAMALYATSLDGGEGPVVIGPFDLPGTDTGPTPLQRFYGAFGGMTLVVGVMLLIFGLLSWFFNLLPTIITMSVLLGCMALVVVLSLMSGLEGDLRDKILAQRAHVRVEREDGKPFGNYLPLVDALAKGDGLAGASPYLEGEIMVRSGLNRQGAILAGIIPERETTVSNLPELVREGSYDYLTHPERIPDPDPFADDRGDETPWRLRHLDDERKKRRKEGRSFEAQTAKQKVADEPPGKDSGLLPLPDIPSLADDGEDEGGWEDPADELARLAGDVGGPDEAAADAAGTDDGADAGKDDGADAGKDDAADAAGQGDAGSAGGVHGGTLGARGGPPGPDDGADEGEGGGLLNKLPRRKVLGLDGGGLLAPTEAQDEAEGWEDPADEVERLREQGVLPPSAGDGGAEDDGEDPAADGGDDAAPAGGEGGGLSIHGEAEQVYPLLIGRELSAELGVREGAQVQLITPIGRMTPAGRIPGQLVTKVAGIFFSGMYEYDRKNVYAPLPVVQRFLLVGDRVSGIEIKLVDVEKIDAGKAEVERIVDAMGRSDELIVEDWRDLNRNLFSAMFLEKVAMFIALLFVVLVASFGILASNLMSVMEKAKEIAILKAMGTADAGIMRIFIAEGLVMGMLGSFGGIALGLALCAALDRFGLPLNENVYYIEKLPVVVNPGEVALVGVAALVIVCFSSLYPALVASRLRPVDGLRHAD